jgi:hypothetical protein
MFASNLVRVSSRSFSNVSRDVEFVHSCTKFFILARRSQHLVTEVLFRYVGLGMLFECVPLCWCELFSTFNVSGA